MSDVVPCNCSICSKFGSLLTFVPVPQFKLISGEDNLTEYRFNTQRIAHLFCKTCGIQSPSEGISSLGSEMVAVNVRCLDKVDFKSLTRKEFDGLSL